MPIGNCPNGDLLRSKLILQPASRAADDLTISKKRLRISRMRIAKHSTAKYLPRLYREPYLEVASESWLRSIQ